MSGKSLQYTIEIVNGSVVTCQRGVYPDSSVLHGQEFRQLCAWYETVEAAKLANPGYEDLTGQETYRPEACLPAEPEPWFDEAAAGERWTDDY